MQHQCDTLSHTANISGVNIRQARERKNMGQVELAAALRIDFGIMLNQSDISEIERGMRGVKDFEIDAVARLLGVTPTWLLRGDDDDKQ